MWATKEKKNEREPALKMLPYKQTTRDFTLTYEKY